MRPVGAESFHTDGQTDRPDMTNLIVALCNFANAPKKKMNSELKIFLCSWEWEIINHVKRWNNFKKY